jgi:hypothetical protein
MFATAENKAALLLTLERFLCSSAGHFLHLLATPTHHLQLDLAWSTSTFFMAFLHTDMNPTIQNLPANVSTRPTKFDIVEITATNHKLLFTTPALDRWCNTFTGPTGTRMADSRAFVVSAT